ncbi:MAG TPA: hypothetical protein VFI56_28695, partial [Vicinamibacterales bacterium]|nr:hypothetical protein [Vicinamibacterales bacterium]
MSWLSKPAIERLLATKHITIDEFKPENLGSAQYDVSLGENFYREKTPSTTYGGLTGNKSYARRLYNPYDERHVRDRWQLDQPISHEDWIERSGVPLVNVGLDEKLIILEPGEMILAHTEEFIGGSCDFVTTKMYARSSSGRNGLEVCRCLPPETEVRRASGAPALLGEIRVGDELLNVDRHGCSRKATVRTVRRSGEAKSLVRIETSGGRVLQCSIDHLLRVSRSDGLHTTQAADLRINDELPVLMRWEPSSNDSINFHEAR